MGAAILITWPDFEPDDPATGRRLTAAGHDLRLAPRRAQRTPAEMIELLDGVAAAIVSTDPFDVLTPHTGGLSKRSVGEMARRSTDAVLDVLAGRVPDGIVATESLQAKASAAR